MPDLSIASFASPPPLPSAAPPSSIDAGGNGGFGDHFQRASKPVDNSSNNQNPLQSTPNSPTGRNAPGPKDYAPPSASKGPNGQDSGNGNPAPDPSTTLSASAQQDSSKPDAPTLTPDGKAPNAGHDEKTPADDAAAASAAAALLIPQTPAVADKANPLVSANSPSDGATGCDPHNCDATTKPQVTAATLATSQSLRAAAAQAAAGTAGDTSADTANALPTAAPAPLPITSDAISSETSAADSLLPVGAKSNAPTTNSPASTPTADPNSPDIKAADVPAVIAQTATAATVVADSTTSPLADATTKQTRDKSLANSGDASSATNPGLAAAQALAAIQVATPPADGDSTGDDGERPSKPTAKLEGLASTANANTATGGPNATGATAANTPARVGYSFGAKPADAPAGSNGISDVDRVRFVQRVARAFQAAQDEGGQIRLRLSPPSLGSLKLEVQVQDGTLSAKLTTETESAKSLLLDNLSTLRDRLGEQNIRMTRFEVEVKDPAPGGGLPDTLPGNSNPNQQGQQPSNRRAKRTDDGGLAPLSAARPNPITDAGQLNVVI